MEFRTEVVPFSLGQNISHDDPIMFVGSCFSEHIQREMKRLHFPVLPFSNGVIFHPLAIADALKDAMECRKFTENDVRWHEGLWKSLAHHSSYNHADKNQHLERINEEIQRSHNDLKQVKMLFVTLGSAMGYVHKEAGRVVANCNRLPQQDFEKMLFDVEPMAEVLSQTFKKLKEMNAGVEIVLTVSPVRHWREGALENQRSKARLILLCEKLVKEGICRYFPAYEMMMDDLRDYRFYKEDLIHPNSQAITYIKEKLFDVILSASAKSKCVEMEKWVRSEEHVGIHESKEDTEKRKAEAARQIRLILDRK